MNYFIPNIRSKNAWKEDHYLGKGKLAITWHRDPGLVYTSSVAVYVHEPKNTVINQEVCKQTPEKNSGEPKDVNDLPKEWRLGIRRLWDTETPSLLVKLDDGDVYYMLDDFGVQYEHAVYGASTPRFSSTHRHLDESSSITYDSIFQKCNTALETMIECCNMTFDNESELERVNEAQHIHTLLEDEWIRSFWYFGSKHAELQSWWCYHMKILEDIWEKLENNMYCLLYKLSNEIDYSLLKKLSSLLIHRLTERADMREKWKEVYSDPFFKVVPEVQRPIQHPVFTEYSYMPEDLGQWIEWISNQ